MLKPVVWWVVGVLAGSASATERGAIRALNGAAGAEIASPQFPGWYAQTWLQRYEADRFTDGSGDPAHFGLVTPAGIVNVRREGSVKATVAVLRGTWLSEFRLGEAKFGMSAALPLVQLKQSLALTPEFGASVPAPLQTALRTQLDQIAQSASGSRSGAGDVELMPYLDWQTDSYRYAFGLGLVAPTGSYDAARAVNPGAGKFWTLRPLVVASYVWESGWDVTFRGTYSINQKNKDTGNRSGQYLAFDASVNRKLGETWKLGLQSYANVQTTADRCADPVASLCGKVRVFGLGPALSYTSDEGSWYADAKLLKEFGARNRPEGWTAWLRLNFRIDN